MKLTIEQDLTRQSPPISGFAKVRGKNPPKNPIAVNLFLQLGLLLHFTAAIHFTANNSTYGLQCIQISASYSISDFVCIFVFLPVGRMSPSK